MGIIVKRDDSFTVYEYDNGYMLECSGRDVDNDWTTQKVIHANLELLLEGIRDILTLPKN